MGKKHIEKRKFEYYKKSFVFLVIFSLLISSSIILNNLSSQKNEKAKWTFMVYMAGDNSLDNSLLQMPLDDINEMEIAGSTDNVNIIVLADRKRDDDTIYRIKKDENGYSPGEDEHDGENLDWDEPISEILNEEYDNFPDDGELKMDESQTLVDFIEWTIENYPAENYFLDLWNHGKGWKWICSDNSNYLTLDEVKSGLTETTESKGKLDIMGLDACSMGYLEVFYHFKDYADFIVASEEEWPEDGWAYNDFLPKLIENPNMEAKDLASNIVYDSVEAYRDQTDLPITHSAINLKKVNKVVESLDDFSQALMDSYPYITSDLRNIRNDLPSFKDNAIDLYSFTILIEKNGTKDLEISARNLMGSINNAVIAEDHFTVDKDEASENAHGISIYFPKNKASFENNFNDLNFSKNSIWDEFLSYYYKTSSEPNANFKTIKGDILDSDDNDIPDSIKVTYEVESSEIEVNVTIYVYDSNNVLVQTLYDEYNKNENPSVRNRTFNNKKFGNDTYTACVSLNNKDGLQDYGEFLGHLEKSSTRLSSKEVELTRKPDDIAKYIISINNNGNMDRNPYDTVSLEISEVPNKWNASLDDDNDPKTEFINKIDVKTNSFKNITLTLETSAEAENGKYNISVIAISEDGLESNNLILSTTISQTYRVNLTIDGKKEKIVNSKPGDDIEIRLTLINEGNFDDTIVLDIEGSERNWASFNGTPIYRLHPDESKEVIVFIKIPDSADIKKIDFKIVAVSRNGTSSDFANIIVDVEAKLIFGCKPFNFFLYVFGIFGGFTLFLLFRKNRGKKIVSKFIKENNKKKDEKGKTPIRIESLNDKDKKLK